jgi:transcriptional regulator with XRE-family HTH domain
MSLVSGLESLNIQDLQRCVDMPKQKMGRPMKGLSQQTVADMLDVSQPTVSRLVHSGALETYADGSIRPDSVAHLGASRPVPSHAPNEPHKGATRHDYHLERARLERAKADLAELKLKAARGKLIDKKQVEDTATAVYRQVREGIEDGVERLSVITAAKYGLPEPELRQLFSEHWYKVLEDLADELEDGLAGQVLR